MKFKLFLLIPFFFLGKSTSEETFFWGQNGHRATAKIAENHLKKRVKKKIDKLLNGQSLAFVSTFADEIKSDRAYSKYYSWHYINMDLHETYATTAKNPKGDLVTGINECIKILKDKNSTDEDKSFHLKMLVHFVGDLHQPLHIGQREDKGGNTVQVQWFGTGTNLHSVWDTKMIEEWNMSYLELADNAKDLTKKQIKAIEAGTLVEWVDEVHELTKKVYSSAKVGENLRYRYSYDHFGTVRDQLQKGGIRLAKILNEIFC
ncbi:S1/P1 Nuclease [Tenacibaculum todarodis]|uniref:S1/P1 Nuclease n=1 Tax=Tenacibaculum todarodis TaxID=1850252 RepID=A0A1L3JIK4_9FLAO|nr:S1/P1 nuclease [Tenacibaculum todarodis]APG64944.1 S1/P1 Nuclease [Tenacibaculum todarodis]